MIKAVTENDELVNVKATKDGKLMVETSGGEGGTTENVETTLNASVQTVGTTPTSIAINKKVTSIMVANYSDTADLSITAGGSTFVIGSNIATTITVNKQVTNVSIIATEEGTKAQVIIEGVE